MSDSSKLKFQVTIPSDDTPQDEPVFSVMIGSEDKLSASNGSFNCTLSDLFSQVAESYKHDKQALHRFSYYLLLQAKEFAQDEQNSGGVDKTISVNKE